MTTNANRFRPTRAGIVNLWDYTSEVFSFADGRLVLRGANGSGKTKALEVLFPFVLDGRLDARRLDPFSGENRTMKENLLWRGGDTAHGYAWLEFGDGHRYVTVGVGLRAQRHHTTPTAWFFVADGRVGRDGEDEGDIVLVDHDGRPRTRAALAAALGDGVVVERARDHRRRVDERLFGLGTERYEAMLDLVLTLRRPMLAKDLDPRLLSETLARSLRPLDDQLLEQVARSFDDLDAVQRDLDRLIAADEAARRFVNDYRGYLRTQARHRADAAIEAHAALERATRRQAEAHQALDEARAAEALAEAEVESARDRLANDRARCDALKASDAFRAAGQLEHLERSVRDLARGAEHAEHVLTSAEADVVAGEAAHADAEQAYRSAVAEAERARPRLSGSAAAAGIAWVSADAEGSSAGIRERCRGRTAARRADVEAVTAALKVLADAERRLALAEEEVERGDAAVESAMGQLAAAEAGVVAARQRLAVDVGEWADAHPSVVASDDRATLLALVEAIGDGSAEGLDGTWRARLEPRTSAVAAVRAGIARAGAELAAQAAALETRRADILAERDDAPAPVAWRGAGRDGRPGAPLWRLVRFADRVDPEAAAGIEAGLEAAGLLDAWVMPDGTVACGELDAFLVTESADGTADGSVAEVLVPDAQSDVDVVVVERLLGSIRLEALGVGTAAVGTTGTYRIGPLSGTHRVEVPRYIGATARSAHRAARVAALDRELALLAGESASLNERLEAVDTWLAAAGAAIGAIPPSSPLSRQLRTRDIAAGRHQQAGAARQEAVARAEELRREVNDMRLALEREARARALPITADGLDAVAAAVTRFAEDGTTLAAALDLVAARGDNLAATAERAASAAAARDEAATQVAERRREHDARSVELSTLRDRMGADVTTVLAEVAEAEAAIAGGEARLAHLHDDVHQAGARRGQAEGAVDAAAESVQAAQTLSGEADRRLAVLQRPDLAGPLGLSLADGVELLDAVEAIATGVAAGDERRKAAQTRVTNGLEDLQTALGAGYHPTWDVDDDIIVVTVADDVGVRSMGAFADGLAAQRAEQEALLSARERALFEDTLLASVCAQIHGRIHSTRELVAAMDAEMRARRLSSGQTVGVAWRPVDSVTPEWKTVHRLLDQDPAHFGPDQFEALRRHFSAEIKAARAADPQSPYRELLARVLDYRSWRQFELSLVEADGGEAQLTKARHARLSGGEKAASLHLPLFAAAHAAFAGARAECPRLLALDEAFAGIDDQGRAELLSLTVAFDLDLFMTGFDLWAVHRSVAAVAHYDLLHLADDHAVSSLLVLWNGTELVEGPDAEAALAALAG